MEANVKNLMPRRAPAPKPKRSSPPRRPQAPQSKPKASMLPAHRSSLMLPPGAPISTLSPLDNSYVPSFMQSGSSSRNKLADFGEAPAYQIAARQPVTNKYAGIFDTINQSVSKIFSNRSGSMNSGAAQISSGGGSLQSVSDEIGGLGAGSTPLIIGGVGLVLVIALMSGRR
jgi:hypothetical protein